MTQQRLRVFLSYRRDDCSLHAEQLASYLRDKADADVFLDTDAIVLGENFAKRIEREITRCDVVVVMIGDDWLTLTGHDGTRRIDDPLDWIHLEVKAALDRDVPVVPVLVEGMKMPRPDQLPDSLSELAYRNGAELRASAWSFDIERLGAALAQLAKRSPPTDPSPPPRPPRRSLDMAAAHAFVQSIPPGRWSTYKSVAIAAGAPTGAQAIGTWLLRRGDQIPHPWRVLDRHGRVSPGWSGSEGLPSSAEEVRDLLTAEGVSFSDKHEAVASARWYAPGEKDESKQVLIVAARQAYPDYLLSGSYICQAGRRFRDITHLGFYGAREIKAEIAAIRHHRDEVAFSEANAAALGESDGPYDAEVAALIKRVLDPTAAWSHHRHSGSVHQVFLLTAADDPTTVRLPQVVRHEGPSAWTQSHRYANLDILAAAPVTTADL